MAVEIPGPVDANGNIALDSAEGAVIPISSRSQDGTPIDLTGRSFRFVVPGRFEVDTVQDPDNPFRHWLILTPDHGDQLRTTDVSFSLLDTEASIPIAVWRGKIRRLS